LTKITLSPSASSLTLEIKLTTGVANLVHYREQLQHQPIFITDRAEGNGFQELDELILNISC
ncbi:MAG: hypothetical protein ACRC2V_13290, partial [Xenococcaceae cyanobacterium]